MRNKERWIECKDFENYEVSTMGNIRSIKREVLVNGVIRRYVSRLLRQNTCSRGFRNVTISVDGNRVSRRVHRLVADSFLPVDEERLHVVHKDGDKGNNNLSNLRRCTHIGTDYYIP